MRITENSVTIRLISGRELFQLITLLCFFESPYLIRFGTIDLIYTGLKFLALIYVFFHVRRIRMNMMVWAIAASELSLWFSTYRMGTPIGGMTVNALSVILFVFMLNIMLEDNPLRCIKTLFFIFEILIYINVLTMLLFPDGLYNPYGYLHAVKKYYFLGHQNSMGIYALVGISLGYILLELEGHTRIRRLRLVLLEAASLLFVFKVWSAISIVGIVGIIFLNTVDEIRKKGLKISLWWSVGANVAIFVLFVILQRLNIFESFFVNVLKRETTLSGRTEIWTKALRFFIKDPIWGIGKGQGATAFGFTTAHNRYMNTLFTSGLVGIGILLWMIVLLCLKLKDIDSRIVRIFIFFFSILLLIMQGETYEGTSFYVMMILAYDVETIIRYKGIKKVQSQ